MAPRDPLKSTPRVQRTIVKTNTTKKPTSVANTASAIKKTMSTRKATEKVPLTVNNTPAEPRQRTKTFPAVATPKPKENKSVPLPSSVTKSGRKLWKRRPKPAHSGVPVPEKMRQLIQKQLGNPDCSF